MSNIFISECGEFIAIRIPGMQPNFDVWKYDGSELWEGERYVERPDKKGCYNSRRLYTEGFAQSKKIVGSWSNFGHYATKGEKKGKWIEEFEVLLHDLENKKSLIVRFKTPIKSLSPMFSSRRRGLADRLPEVTTPAGVT